jgi:hypothetical protein
MLSLFYVLRVGRMMRQPRRQTWERRAMDVRATISEVSAVRKIDASGPSAESPDGGQARRSPCFPEGLLDWDVIRPQGTKARPLFTGASHEPRRGDRPRPA